MNRKNTYDQGRFFLRVLFWLILLASFAAGCAQYMPFTLSALPWIIKDLLPKAVILWAVCRGSFPGLVLLVVSLFSEIDTFSDLMQYGVVGMVTPAAILSTAQVLLTLLLVGACVTNSSASAYLSSRRELRTQQDLILEIVLLVLTFGGGKLAEIIYYRVQIYSNLPSSPQGAAAVMATLCSWL